MWDQTASTAVQNGGAQLRLTDVRDGDRPALIILGQLFPGYSSQRPSLGGPLDQAGVRGEFELNVLRPAFTEKW